MEINNKTIILTGAARVGKSVAQHLLSKNAKLAVTYFTKPPEFDFDYDISKVSFIRADLTNQKDVANVVATTLKKFGRIDGLVHMAANYERTPWAQLNEEAWDKSMKPIVQSSFLLSKAVGDELLKSTEEVKGKMILVSDWSVLTQPYKDYLPYNVAKAAVVGLTKSLAKELAPGVAVNCIAPGPILKPDNLTGQENEEVLSNTPLHRWGGPDEIAKAVIYFLETDFVTGQVLYVDGGRSIA